MDRIDLIIKDRIKREIKEKGFKKVINMIDRLKEQEKYLETVGIYENMIRQIFREEFALIKENEKMNKKCVYCGRKNIVIGNCGVCKNCCRSFIAVCKDDQCEIGEEVKEEIIEEFEKYIKK